MRKQAAGSTNPAALLRLDQDLIDCGFPCPVIGSDRNFPGPDALSHRRSRSSAETEKGRGSALCTSSLLNDYCTWLAIFSRAAGYSTARSTTWSFTASTFRIS